MPRFEPVVCRAARRATLARVAPQLAHVRTECGFRRYATSLGPTSRKARHGEAGRADGETTGCYLVLIR
jgi:hypothetical protein